MKDLVHPRSVFSFYRALRRSSPSPEVYTLYTLDVIGRDFPSLFRLVMTERPGEAAHREVLNHADEVHGDPLCQSEENTRDTHWLPLVKP